MHNSIPEQLESITKTVLNDIGIDKIFFTHDPGFEPRLTVRYINKSIVIIDVYPEILQFMNDLKPKTDD